MLKGKLRGLVILMAGLCAGMLLAACGEKSTGSSNTNYFYKSLNDVEKNDTEAATEETNQDLYLIVDLNSARETIRVYRYQNGLEYQYYYGLSTEFCNKYGDHTSQANFKCGDAVFLSETNSEGRLTKVTKADSVWVYDDIKRFDVDTDKNTLTIGDTEYRVDENTFFFQGVEQTKLDKITEDDKIEAVGIDNRLLSVSVLTGHGTLRLTHTDLFEGSHLQLNKNIFVEITKDMEMDLPEGEYKLVVANNGWGGKKKIKISRGETTEVNLDKIKGDGPESGAIQFVVDATGAQILIDDKLIDYSNPVDITYGVHTLTVVAEGYDVWKRMLFVNSKEATVVISLKEGTAEAKEAGDKSESSSEKSSESSSESDSQNSSEKSSENSSESSKDSDKDQVTDYLSIIEEMLSSLY